MNISSRQKLPFAFVVLSITGLVLLYSYVRAQESSFLLIDGVFQTLAPLRRLAEGQWFFRDFVSYIGIGHTLVYLPVYLLTGGTLFSSMFSAHLMTCLCTGTTLTVLFRCLVGSWKWAFLASCCLLANAIFPRVLSYEILHPHYIDPGVSGRPIRLFLPTLILLVLMAFWRKWEFSKQWPISIQRTLCLSALGSAAVFYSNDYGIPTFCTLPLCFILFAHRNPHRWREVGLYAISAPFFLFVFGSVLTSGHFLDWFQYNFQWVSKAQFWYFEVYETKILKLQDWLLLFNHERGYKWEFFFLLPCLLYARRGRSALSAPAILSFLGFTHFFATLLTQFGSFRNSSYEMGVALIHPFLIVYVVIFLFQQMRWNFPLSLGRKNLNKYFPYFCWFLGTWFVYQSYRFNHSYNHLLDSSAPFSRFLDPERKSDALVLDKVREKLGEGPVLSEYPGLDMLKFGRINDSRVDLFIHAFGEERDRIRKKIENREEILVSTVSPLYTYWAQWSLRQNWWFFRPLLQNYEILATSPAYVLRTPRTTPLTVAEQSLPCDWQPREKGGYVFQVDFSSLKKDRWLAEVTLKVTPAPLSSWKSKWQRELFILEFFALPNFPDWSGDGGQIGKAVDGEPIVFPLHGTPEKPSRFDLKLAGTFDRDFSIQSCEAKVFAPMSEIIKPSIPWYSERLTSLNGTR